MLTMLAVKTKCGRAYRSCGKNKGKTSNESAGAISSEVAISCEA
jgi:hypothetical protein